MSGRDFREKSDTPGEREAETEPASDLLLRAAMHRRALQRKAARGGAPDRGAGESIAAAGKDSGAPVDERTRGRFESATGADLSGVRVHDGGASHQAAAAVGARAYTVGDDVHFAAGQHQPGTADGDRLMAHELAHTVQQKKGVGRQHKRELSEHGDSAEVEADEVAASVVAGERAAPITQSAATIAREEDPNAAGGGAPDPTLGRPATTEFGDFTVLPDESAASLNAEAGEITESDLAERQKLWETLKSGSGDIKIGEIDSKGQAHAGFKVLVLSKLGMLLERPKGALLLSELASGGKAVTIQPASVKIKGGTGAKRGAGSEPNADGTPGPGGTTTIVLDETVTDKDLKVFDERGNEIGLPIYIALGHELIHARHNQKGVNTRAQAATKPGYPMKEEQDTIEGNGSDVSEADLRKERGLPKRAGHAGKDTRGP
jgi:hypothetical protein